MNKNSSQAQLMENAHDLYETVIDDENEDVLWLQEQRQLNKSLSWYKRPATIFVCVLFCVFSLAISICQSSELILVVNQSCNSLLSHNDNNHEQTCDSNSVQVLVSHLQMYTTIVQGTITTLNAGKIGAYSDRYGRKLMLIFLLAATLVGRALKTYLLTFPYFHFYLLIAVDVATQLCGGVFTMLALGNSYITDVVESHERTYSIGLAMAAFFMGMSIGPVVGNIIVHASKEPIHTLYASVGAYVFLLLFVIFFLPESRSTHARKKSRTLSISHKIKQQQQLLVNNLRDVEVPWYKSAISDKIASFFSPLKIFVLPKAHNSYIPREIVFYLLAIECLVLAATAAAGPVLVLYATFKFQWSSIELGNMIFIVGFSRAVTLLGISPLAIKGLKKKFTYFQHKIDKIDFSIIMFSIAIELVGAILIYHARNSAHFYFALTVNSLAALLSPAVNSTIVKYIEEHKAGEIFGALSIVRNFLNLVAPPLFLFIYSKTVSYDPKIVVDVLIVIFVVGLVVGILLWRAMLRSKSLPDTPLLGERERLASSSSSTTLEERNYGSTK